MRTKLRSKTRSKLGHDPIRQVAIDDCRPSPENDRLYRPVDASDPEIIAMADSIRIHGVKEPLVLSADGWILSGHRRRAAAKLAGLATVPARFETISRNDDPDAFLQLLREFNRQREKTREERLREEIVSMNPEDAYESMIAGRRKRSRVATPSISIVGKKERAEITEAKAPLLKAVQLIIEERRDYWPLSDRQIHYALLNDPPLRHASKPDSRYRNDLASYKSVVELLTRARLAGLVPWDAIADETRPVSTWRVWNSPGAFVREQLGDFLKGYWRDLMQSQPNQVEIIGEKNTVRPILQQVAQEYCIPLTTGRGYCSLPPRRDMAERFRRNGKQKLVLLIVSDFDPDGEEIAHSFARSMRDDFGIDAVHAIKVALTADQVREHKLPADMRTTDKQSSNRRKFETRYGHDVFELEALRPEALQQIVYETIDDVIDVDAFNAELAAEKEDAVFLESRRRLVKDALGGLQLESGADE